MLQGVERSMLYVLDSSEVKRYFCDILWLDSLRILLLLRRRVNICIKYIYVTLLVCLLLRLN